MIFQENFDTNEKKLSKQNNRDYYVFILKFLLAFNLCHEE